MFYTFSCLVLVLRMMQYCFVLVFYSQILDHLREIEEARIPLIKALSISYVDMW